MSRNRSFLFSAMLACAISLANTVFGQSFNALARLDPEASVFREDGDQSIVELKLSQPVPWRVFTLTEPNRLVLDFNEVVWSGDPRDESTRIASVAMGSFRPGWSRMVLGLADPLAIESALLSTDATDGTARVVVTLSPTTESSFAKTAGFPENARLVHSRSERTASAVPVRDRLRVVLDPGHGGVDPGAEVDGLREVDLMMTMALELSNVLERTGRVEVVLTRIADVFVPLERRIAIAHQAEGDLFISLHADSLAVGAAKARGATVYTLSDNASDAASQALAERHDRDDLLAGVDLTRQDDEIALVLMELARRETAPRAELFADTLVATFEGAGIPTAGRPRRAAAFSVLKSPDIPSVLLELGFLTDDRDRANLVDEEWRARMSESIRDAILRWADDDAVRRSLVRK